MAFDRKDYGMTKGIPFVRIGDSVDVTVDLKAKRISGPPLVFKAISSLQLSDLPRCDGIMEYREQGGCERDNRNHNHRWSAESPFSDPLKMEI